MGIRRWWRASSLFAVASMALVYVAGVTQLGEAEAEPVRDVPAVSGEVAAEIAELRSDAPAGDDPDDVLDAAVGDPAIAAELAAAEPERSAGELSEALEEIWREPGVYDPVDVGQLFADIGEEATAWLSVLYPSVIGELSGAPFEDRVRSNRIILEASTAASGRYDSPERPWNTGTERPERAELAALNGTERQFIHFDPSNNSGEGSWVEIVGDLEAAETVTVLVPGGSAVLSSANFELYHDRAESFVDAADGKLAIVVWAGASWPSGWIEESWASWAAVASESLSAFTRDLRFQIGDDVPITLAGHSYGGSVVGLAETEPIDVDRVLHVASAGMGNDVYSPEELSAPCRPRYSLTAPGDPISWVQGMPYVPLLGHGADPDDFPGVRNLYPGYLSDAEDAVDDYGVSLVERGISGKEVEGVHSHSEIFYPESDAWNNILAVMLGEEPDLAREQPEAIEGC